MTTPNETINLRCQLEGLGFVVPGEGSGFGTSTVVTPKLCS